MIVELAFALSGNNYGFYFQTAILKKMNHVETTIRRYYLVLGTYVFLDDFLFNPNSLSC